MNNFITTQLLSDVDWNQYIKQPNNFKANTSKLSCAAQLRPLIIKGMKDESAEVQRIINNTDAPNFDNTIVALSNSGELLERATTIMYNLLSAETDDELDELANEMAP